MTPRPILSAEAKVELVIALVLVAAFLHWHEDLAAWARAWLPAPVYTSGREGCAPPATEHEQLHAVLAWRHGRLELIGCQYVGSQSAYVKEPRR